MILTILGVWMSVGTRAKTSCSIWRPIAPEGYAALGNYLMQISYYSVLNFLYRICCYRFSY